MPSSDGKTAVSIPAALSPDGKAFTAQMAARLDRPLAFCLYSEREDLSLPVESCLVLSTKNRENDAPTKIVYNPFQG